MLPEMYVLISEQNQVFVSRIIGKYKSFKGSCSPLEPKVKANFVLATEHLKEKELI